MSDANLLREVSIPYSTVQGTLADSKTYFGSVTARVGFFKAVFKDGGDLASGCNGVLTQKTVKGHPRTRVIGKGEKTIEQHNYVELVYPRKNVSIGKGGMEYRMLIDGKWWKFRVSGRQQDFHSFLCESKEQLLIDVYYQTQTGAKYFVNRKEEN